MGDGDVGPVGHGEGVDDSGEADNVAEVAALCELVGVGGVWGARDGVKWGLIWGEFAGAALILVGEECGVGGGVGEEERRLEVAVVVVVLLKALLGVGEAGGEDGVDARVNLLGGLVGLVEDDGGQVRVENEGWWCCEC